MGVRAYARGEDKVPARLSKKDRKAWAEGWNATARDRDDFRRQVVRPVKKKRTPRKMKTPSHDTEAAVLREAMQIAKARGWYVERRNTGAVKTAEGGFFRYGSPGAADLIVIVPVRGYLPIHIEAEAKRRDGKGRQSESQVAFQESMVDYAVPYFVFTSGEEFEEKIKQISVDFIQRTC